MPGAMGYNMAGGAQNMLKKGHSSSQGLDEAVLRNIEAAKQLATMVSTSMGPNGMNKLVVNHLNKIIVSSDCATLLKEFEVQHPAAQMLSLASQMQDQEFGDGTNFVIALGGELLKLAEELLHEGLHTSEVVSGYKTAMDVTMATIPTLVCHTVENARNPEQLKFAIKSVLMAKQLGFEDILSDLVVKAALAVMPKDGPPNMKQESVRIVKLIGGDISQSEVVHGMLLPRMVEGTITKIQGAKITVFGCGLESEGTETQGTVLIRNAEDMLNYNKSEEKSLEDVISAVAATGCNVIISGGTVSEMALHFCEKYKLMVVKCQSKWDLKRLCATVGATALVRLGPATPEEMGACHKVYMKEYGTKKVTLFEQEGSEDSLVASIVLRSSVVSVINDLERACEDGLATVQHCCKKDAGFLPGGGAFEMEMASRLRKLANETDSLDQYAIRKFGEAFEAIPRVLAVNSGQPSTMLVSNLYAAHAENASGDGLKGPNVGVNIEGGVKDMTVDGIFDLMVTKESGIRLAVDAALTVLRVDQIIMSKQAGGPKPPAQR